MEFDKIPCDVWDSSLTPLLDRDDWNALLVASKSFYGLAKTKSIAPPWPTKSFGIRGSQPITSFTMSFDGEYLAAGSTLGSIDIWNRRRGQITSLRKRDPLTSGSSRRPDGTSGQRRRSQPIGSVLTFAPQGHTLASAHENRIFLQDISDAPGVAAHSSQVLEVECRHGTIYEVTYLAFSEDGAHLIARYGKTACIWKRMPSQTTLSRTCGTAAAYSMTNSGFVLTHKFPLSSSRCQMTSSPCMKFVAVTNAASAEDKGSIDVWNIERSTEDDRQSRTTIQAHKKKTIRGLEFMAYNDNANMMQREDNHFLLSATLQGEIKIWKRQHKNSNTCCNDALETDNTGTFQSAYVCTWTMKVPGKIFSLAMLTPSVLRRADKVYLAVGQSRGQVRAMKVNIWSDGGEEQSMDNVDIGTTRGGESSSLIRSLSNNSDDSEGTTNENSSSNDVLQDFLSLDVVGEQSHHDNIKLLTFSPDGRHLVASRSYDARIWFHLFEK